MVRDDTGMIFDLRGAVRARRLLWAFCLWCGHAERLDPYRTATRAGRNLRLDELAARLRCGKCRMKGKAIVVPAPHAMADRDSITGRRLPAGQASATPDPAP